MTGFDQVFTNGISENSPHKDGAGDPLSKEEVLVGDNMWGIDEIPFILDNLDVDLNTVVESTMETPPSQALLNKIFLTNSSESQKKSFILTALFCDKINQAELIVSTLETDQAKQSSTQDKQGGLNPCQLEHNYITI